MVNRDLITGEIILDKTERLNTGKYKGRTVSSVMISDPKYLLWMIGTNAKYSLSDTWQQYLDEYAYKESNKHYATYMR